MARSAAAEVGSSAAALAADDGPHGHEQQPPDLHLFTEGTATMATPVVAAPQPVAHDITFNLVNIGGVTPGSSAEAGFQRAVALWQSFVGDAVTIRLDVGFSALGPGILGSTGSNSKVVSYSALHAALIADQTSSDDAAAVASLAAGASLAFFTNNSAGTRVFDNDGSANNTYFDVNTANLKALGITTDANGQAIDTGAADGNITFSSSFNWDFDPSDGITAGTIDFVGVAFHEIGHALGFVSGVDIVDYYSGAGPGGQLNLNPYAVFSVLDLFRYSGSGVRDLSYGGSTYFSINGGATNLALFSTGDYQGDGNQASHWKDNLGIGIMDPTSVPAGQANVITAKDIQALDVIGWNKIGASSAGSVSISDVSISEGNSGTKIATFTVTRAGGTAAFDINFATANSSATVADGDYLASSGTLHFAANATTQTISVTINGDSKFESDEAFFVNLSNATNGASIIDSQAAGTITNDDVNHAPVVTAHNVSVGVNQSIAASSMFGVTDQDAGDSITQYGFYDYGSGGGHFTLSGQTLAAGQWNYVNAASLSAVSYVGGSSPGSENLVVAAFDGHDWSAANANWLATGTLTATTQPNHAPMVTAHNVSVGMNQSIAASSLFGVTDQDGDSMVQYSFYDYGSGGGHFALNGQTLAAGQWNYINASSLSAVSYVGGSSPGSENLVVAAFDGHDWSAANANWLQTGTLTATTQPNHAPVVTAHNVSVGANQSVAASSMFGVTDQDAGNSIVQYAFYDYGSGGGHFALNGQTLAAGQWNYINASSLSAVTYVGGSSAGSENLVVAAYDGFDWSAANANWLVTGTLTATTTQPNHAPVVTSHNVSLGVNQSIAASSVFGVTDQDNDAMAQYAFYDYGSGGGHFALNGQTLAAGQWNYINAASLSAVSYVGGSSPGSENLVVAAFDGHDWSAANANWLQTGTLTANWLI